jgi:P-type E1-E2 ATPase
VLEKLARARTVVFDKTGTLTHGTPAIARVSPEPPFAEEELLTLAASTEQYSSHVLAASVLAAADRRDLTLLRTESAAEVPAHGVTARFGDREVVVGKLAFVAEHAPDAYPADLAGGELAIYLAVDGRFAGFLVAADQLRDNARATVLALAKLGVQESMMLTGDARPAANHIARLVGITRVRADCLPADKVDAVRAIRERPVIMVGDGVNDAPVLAVADVGIAMGAKGATAASESADAVILLDDLSRAARAVAIGRDTVRIALQSIWLGIALSIGLMIVAAFGLIPATTGALLQEAVDLATILNALRAIGGRRDARARRCRPDPARHPDGARADLTVGPVARASRTDRRRTAEPRRIRGARSPPGRRRPFTLRGCHACVHRLVADRAGRRTHPGWAATSTCSA